MIKVAVVILNWNGKKFLEQFLPVVCRHSSENNTEVIVADNGSTDDSVSFLKDQFPEVRIIEFQQNYGFALGYHKALELIDAEYYMLLNSDVEVTPDWLAPLAAVMDNDPSIGACMPKIRSYYNRDHFEYAGACGGFIDRFGYPFCRGRILSVIEKDEGQYDSQRSVFWATGACMLVRAETYKKAGGFDGEFFAHMEEIDLCWRIRRLGYNIVVVPSSTVYHIGGGTLPNNNPRKLYLNYRNSLFLLFKNLPLYQLVPVMLTRMILDGASALSYLLSGSGKFCFAVFRAHMAFYRRIPLLISKRRNIRHIIHRGKIKEIYPGSIIFDFFVKRKRYFSEIDW